MSQLQTVGTVHTNVRTVDGVKSITYHDTIVVEFDDNTIWLDTGGWYTITTKTRMNQAANQFDLGFQVWQSKGEWYVKRPDGETVQFTKQGRCMFSRGNK